MALELVPHEHDGQALDVAIARPASADAAPPAVLVFHAWKGRAEHEEARARRIADLGYVAAAVDLYGVGRRGHDADSCRALMMELVGDPPKLRGRIQASFDLVRGLDGVDPDRLGAIGFCFGGLCSLLAARMGLALRGVVSFHGLLKIGEPLETRPVARINVQHGQDDPMVPTEDLAAFAAEMKRIDADWTLHAYPGVVHAFTNPEAPSDSDVLRYDAGADTRSWLEMQRFFADVFTS